MISLNLLKIAISLITGLHTSTEQLLSRYFTSQSCADQETFFSEGFQLWQRFFLVDESRDDQNTTKIGPSSTRQRKPIYLAFCWHHGDGLTSNSGLVAFLGVFRGSGPVLHKKTIWCLQRDSNQWPLYLKSSTLPLVDYTATLYNYWLMRHWIWCDIDQIIPILTEAKPRSILVFSGRYHIISNASLVKNCFII